jgi:ribosome recycling factor
LHSCLCHAAAIFLLLVSAVSPINKNTNTHCSAGMLDHIMVETADFKVALNRIAVVSVLDAHTLSVMPYDPSVRASISLNLAR